ncbi:MAG: OadG family protein [Treponema sp.]|jgi:oxaloacetate decarboxylase gamma subunit|nr:OadG family protein [Treponema sp.]
MTIAQMFGQSGALALLGMAVVFGFLTILIVVISLTGRVIHALGLDKEAVTGNKAAAVNAVPGGIDGTIVAAITGAVKTYRKNNAK